MMKKLYLLLLILCLVTFKFGIVVGDSMQPSIEDGDIIVAWRGSSLVTYNSVVLLNKGDSSIIKRVIGCPNDIISIKSSKLFVNHTEISDYTSFDIPEISLNLDEYYVLGDNSAQSTDSRYFGAIKEKQLLGVVLFTINPLLLLTILVIVFFVALFTDSKIFKQKILGLNL